MNLLQEIALESLRTLFVASPYLLFGLVAAGFLHVLLPTSLIQRWMGRPGLSGVVRAALVGVPLPVCSCGVLPISIEMRRKGASAPASLSFLTTTPESSIDSILFTWGLMGPVMAIARPIAAFFTATLGGVLAIAYLPDDDPAPPPEEPAEDETCDASSVSHPQAPEALTALRSWLRELVRGRTEGKEGGADLWKTVVKPSLRYGFVELLDDLAFWLLLGVLLAGVLGAVMPDDLAERGLGAGIMPMLLLLAVGVPLYMCASSSTPIAAALMAKGVSPGAALVFLLAGPATNAATVVLLARTFGRRFVRIYLLSVVAGALTAGLALEALVLRLGWEITTPLVVAEDAGSSIPKWLAMALLSVLLLLSLWRGAGRRGWQELTAGFAGFLPVTDAAGRSRRRRRMVGAAILLALVGYAITGFHVVPPDAQGYGFLFGSLVRENLGPGGLYYLPPAPFGRWEVWRTRYARKADIGFRTDLEMLAERRELTRLANPDDWHSPVTAMNADPRKTSYLTADENLLEMSFTVHYTLSDPVAFFYRLDHRHDLVGLYAEAVAREFLATNPLEELLTTRRQEIEEAIASTLAQRLEAIASGIRLTAVRIVDIHPPGETVNAFRDVSSAREDKETRIHQAREKLAGELPRARGEAAGIVATAQSTADSLRTEAQGRSDAFVATAEAVAVRRELLEHLLWIETVERALGGREKYVVPSGSTGGRVSLWQNPPAESATQTTTEKKP